MRFAVLIASELCDASSTCLKYTGCSFACVSGAVFLGSCCRPLLMYEGQVFYYTTNICRCYCIIIKTTRDAGRNACNCNNRQHVFRKALTINSSD